MDILFVDDKPESIALAVDAINDSGYHCLTNDFENMKNVLKSLDPSIIILDYKRNSDIAGREWIDFIWETKFIPIIFHTGFFEDLISDLGESEYNGHPLVTVLKKGINTSEELISQIKKYEIIINEIDKFGSALEITKKDIIQATLKQTMDVMDQEYLLNNIEQLTSILNRKFANYMESQSRGTLEPFEMYIYPPVSDSLMTGDIIKKNDEDLFYVILTPSCDLVERVGASEKVHLARIGDGRFITNACNITNGGNNKSRKEQKKKLAEKLLNSGYNNGIFALPPLKKYYSKSMAINFKDCSYTDRNEICLGTNNSSDDCLYRRIASIDSPFRETVIWAYMGWACRPGLPERNIDDWANNILNEVFTNTSDEGG